MFKFFTVKFNKIVAQKSTLGKSAFTFVEVLLSVVLMAFIFLLLNTILSTTTKTWEKGEKHSDYQMEGRSAIYQLKKDIYSALINRYGSRISAPVSSNKAFKNLFDNRVLMPFEINRKLGKPIDNDGKDNGTQKKAILFADDAFDSISFIKSATLSKNIIAPSLVAYYVAYTKDSPLKNSRSSMKLYRHFHTGKNAKELINAISTRINIGIRDDKNALEELPVLLSGKVTNKDIPFLFSSQHPNPDFPTETITPSSNDLAEIKDEAIAHNIVRFEIKAQKLLGQDASEDGKMELLGAKELNSLLEISNDNDEWPTLVAPDFIDITISVIDDVTAKRLNERDDWLVDWDENNSVFSTNKNFSKLIKRNSKTFTIRIGIASSQ